MTNPSVQVRIDVGGKDFIPHTLIVVTDSAEIKREFGLVPAAHGTMAGPGLLKLIAAN